MIEPTAKHALEQSERHRPARLARTDVAAIRDLYARLWARPLDGHRNSLTIWLPRGDRERAAARLGRHTPAVTIEGEWRVKQALSLDLVIRAHSLKNDPQRNWKLKIAHHRFRNVNTQNYQFVREVTRAVRLGLGWCQWRESGASARARLDATQDGLQVRLSLHQKAAILRLSSPPWTPPEGEGRTRIGFRQTLWSLHRREPPLVEVISGTFCLTDAAETLLPAFRDEATRNPTLRELRDQ